MTFTRRNILSLGTGAVAAGVLGLPRGARAADTITVLNWQGYGTDEAWALKIFKEKTGIEVVSDYFNSEPEMLTKLRTNPGVYDVVLVNCARTQQALAEGLLEPIDFSQFPNAAGLSPELRENPDLIADGKTYGVAWVWGMNALAFRTGTPKPDSYAALGDPAYAKKVGLYDDAVTAVAVGAFLTGQDMNDPKDLAAVMDKLKALKPNVRTIWSSEDQWNKAFSAGEFDLSIYWSGASVRSQRNFKLPVEFVVPKEGAIGWFDSLAIPATSSNKESAAKFIDYMISPDFYYEWATKIGAPASASAAAMEKLPADDVSRMVHKPEYLKTMSFMAPIPDERREAFSNLWSEVKAFYAS